MNDPLGFPPVYAPRSIRTYSVSIILISIFFSTLAFFIILSAHPAKDSERARKAMESVSKTFIGGDWKTKDGISAGKINSSAVLVEIENLMREEDKSAVIEKASEGGTLSISAPLDFLYFADDDKVRKERSRFMAKIAEIIAEWPEKRSLKLDLMISVDDAREKDFSLLKTRLANLAAFMAKAGLPEKNVALGVASGGGKTVSFTFRVAEDG